MWLGKRCLTVCLSPDVRCRDPGAGVGVDSVWEQGKLEMRKMLEDAAESLSSVDAVFGGSYYGVGPSFNHYLSSNAPYAIIANPKR